MTIRIIILVFIGLTGGVCTSCQSDDDLQYPDVKIEKFNYLALGDSYTIGQSVSQDSTFPQQLVDRLKLDDIEIDTLEIIARTGWTTTQLLNELDQRQISDNFDLVTILIGVNNQYSHLPLSVFKAEFPRLVEQAVQHTGGCRDKVIILSIPDYSFTPFAASWPEVSDEIDEYNALKLHLSDSLGVTFYDITDISRKGLDEPNLVASDGLHPSARQYKHWVERILEGVKSRLKL